MQSGERCRSHSSRGATKRSAKPMSKRCAESRWPAINGRRRFVSCVSKTFRAARRARSCATKWRRSFPELVRTRAGLALFSVSSGQPRVWNTAARRQRRATTAPPSLRGTSQGIAGELSVLDPLDIFGHAVAVQAVPSEAGEAFGDARFQDPAVALAPVTQRGERQDLAGDEGLALCGPHADLDA